MALTLRRHGNSTAVAARTASEYAAGWHREDVTGHPPVPDEIEPDLRSRLAGRNQRRNFEARMAWWPHDGNAWAVVTDLHQTGRHDEATTLARLLYWCDQRAKASGHVIWELAP